MSDHTEHLTPVQQLIVDCVRRQPGEFTRSGLARLLVGSSSVRVSGLRGHPQFGCLADQGRKAVTGDIDSLLQQGWLALDSWQKLTISE